MNEFVQTLLISCIPAVVTGIATFFVAHKNASAQIKVVKEQNKHDLEQLMEQHKIDLDSLEKQHQQELEKIEIEHQHKLEVIAKENENSLSQNFMNGLIGGIMKMPEAKAEIAKGIRQSSKKKGGKR